MILELAIHYDYKQPAHLLSSLIYNNWLAVDWHFLLFEVTFYKWNPNVKYGQCGL